MLTHAVECMIKRSKFQQAEAHGPHDISVHASHLSNLYDVICSACCFVGNLALNNTEVKQLVPASSSYPTLAAGLGGKYTYCLDARPAPARSPAHTHTD